VGSCSFLGERGTYLEKLEPCDRSTGDEIEFSPQDRILSGPIPKLWVAPPFRSQINQGAFGTVFRARETEPSKISTKFYAVKVMRSGLQDAYVLREGEVSDLVRQRPHPCIVLVHDVRLVDFENARTLYMVLEFCHGVKLLSRGDPCFDLLAVILYYTRTPARVMPESYARQWFAEVFLGLEHVHIRMRALLRDLKHQNVVFTSSGHAKLADFGLGRLDVYAPNQQWSFGHPPGTPGFVAPEVYFNRPYNYACDFYSLGVLLWVMRTGGATGYGDPPTGRRTHATYTSRAHDQEILADYVRHPHVFGVVSLKKSGQHGEDARLLIESLIAKNPAKRGSHNVIRAASFLQDMCLPDINNTPQEVREWLDARPLFDVVGAT